MTGEKEFLMMINTKFPWIYHTVWQLTSNIQENLVLPSGYCYHTACHIHLPDCTASYSPAIMVGAVPSSRTVLKILPNCIMSLPSTVRIQEDGLLKGWQPSTYLTGNKSIYQENESIKYHPSNVGN
jgi:hypothetical protein